MLLAFSLQSYITQTHIHLAPDSIVSYKELAAAKSPGVNLQKHSQDKFPANDDPANCPICQEILHTGHFVTPAAASLLLPSVTVSIIAVVTKITVATQYASHAWRSRAPPAA